MSENHTHTDRFLALAQYLVDHPAAAALIIMIDDRAIDPAFIVPRVLRPQEIPVNAPPFGSLADTLELLRVLRHMSAVQTKDGGFQLSYIASHVVPPLRAFFQRDLELAPAGDYADEVMRLLNKENALPPDPSNGPYTNRIGILAAMRALAPRLTADDAVRWLTRPRDEFAGSTALDLLARREVDRVLTRIASADITSLYF